MDFHPLVIHYPIAFLTAYSAFELVRLRKLVALPHWFYIKATLVILGEMGAIATLITGRIATEQMIGVPLVDMYRNFSVITTLIFGIIALSYLYEWFRPNKWSLFIMRPVILVPLTIIGLFFIVVMGGLFGAMVYGTHFDPYLAPVFKLLGVY